MTYVGLFPVDLRWDLKFTQRRPWVNAASSSDMSFNYFKVRVVRVRFKKPVIKPRPGAVIIVGEASRYGLITINSKCRPYEQAHPFSKCTESLIAHVCAHPRARWCY